MARTEALTFAAQTGDSHQVAALVAGGVPVDAKNGHGRTALDLAVWADQVAVVRLLLSLGADAEQRIGEYRENYPLRFAAARGMADMAAALLEDGALPEGHPEGRRGTPVVMAAVQGETTIVELLLDRGVSIEGTHAAAGRPLVSAAYEGHPETVRFLLERGAQPRREALTAAESRVDHYSSDPARQVEFAETIAILNDALAKVTDDQVDLRDTVTGYAATENDTQST